MAISHFGRNLKAIREDRGLTQTELAERLEITQNTVSAWETRGKMPKQPSMRDVLCGVLSCSPQDLFGFTDGYYYKRSGLDQRDAASSESYAPVIGNIAAGEPREAIEQREIHWIDPEILDAHPDGFFLKVSGDSMDKVLPDGCFAFVAPGDVQSGDVAAVKVNGDEATIKRVKIFDGVVILEPESNNPEHRRRVIDESDPDAPAVRILGKVVWFSSRV